MQTFQDNSKLVAMIKNRPSLSVIPPINKRIMASRLGFVTIGYVGFASIASLVAYKFGVDQLSLYLTK